MTYSTRRNQIKSSNIILVLCTSSILLSGCDSKESEQKQGTTPTHL